MPRRKRCLELSQSERLSLEQARDRHPKAYVRERAAALLAIASGQRAHALAKQGLLKPRDPDTIYAWLNKYEAKGLAALYQLPRKDGVFPPRAFGPVT